MLLVDDQSALRALIAESLGDEGYEVRSAPDGPAALKLLDEHGALDVLVSDLGLAGGMNGQRLADLVRAVFPMLPVVFITGDHHAPGRQGDRLPHTEIILKPFSLMDLAAKLREILSAQPSWVTPP